MRWRLPPFRFSLRTLFLVVAVCAVGLGFLFWTPHSRRNRLNAAARLRIDPSTSFNSVPGAALSTTSRSAPTAAISPRSTATGRFMCCRSMGGSKASTARVFQKKFEESGPQGLECANLGIYTYVQ